MHRSLRPRALVLFAAAGLAISGTALGQNGPEPAPVTPPPAASAPAAPAMPASVVVRDIHTGDARRDTMLKLMRPITVDFQEKRLEDVIAFVRDFSGADIEALWIDDQNPTGLDKEKVISVKVTNGTVLSLMEKVLEKAKADSGDNSWQMSDSGAFQIGSKERLNKYRRVEIYDINDLLMEVPDYRDVPKIDLQQALQAAQSGGGGGGGKSPFKDENEKNDEQRMRDREKQAEDLQKLITDLVETEQWTDNGGNGGTIRYYKGTLIVNAPDYIHRGIDGYHWWPGTATQSSVVKGRRYVTLTTDNGISKIMGFGKQPVSAVAGGQVISSGGGGGGGR